MADILKISLQGVLAGGEKWTVNPVFRIGPPGDTIDTAKGLALVTAINALVPGTGITNLWGNGTALNGVKIEARFVDGRLEAVYEGVRSAIVVFTGTQLHPNQCSVVSSLRTPLAGQSGRGRVFWPATGATLLAGTSRISATNVQALNTAVKTYFLAIDGAIESVLGPVNAQLSVWSRKNDTTAPVLRIQAGDIVDTQRRRRDTLIETYYETPYV